MRFRHFSFTAEFTISSLTMLEATDFIQIHFLGKLSRSSLRENYQLRDKKICMRKTLSIVFARKNRGVSRPSWSKESPIDGEVLSGSPKMKLKMTGDHLVFLL